LNYFSFFAYGQQGKGPTECPGNSSGNVGEDSPSAVKTDLCALAFNRRANKLFKQKPLVVREENASQTAKTAAAVWSVEG
jgi:hypothetical protein